MTSACMQTAPVSLGASTAFMTFTSGAGIRLNLGAQHYPTKNLFRRTGDVLCSSSQTQRDIF